MRFETKMKKKKLEKTSSSFYNKREFLTEKMIFKKSKKSVKKRFRTKVHASLEFWDSERKMIVSYEKGVKKHENGVFFPNKFYFYLEEILFHIPNHLSPKTLWYFECINNKNWLAYFNKSNYTWFNFFVFSFVQKSGFIISRFRLLDSKSISPNFFCWDMKNLSERNFCILLCKKIFSFYPSFLISLLVNRLKPGSLKIGIMGKTSIMFFSIDNGLSQTSPLFICLNSKKKKKKIKKTP